MGMTSRVRRMEKLLGRPEDVVVPVVWGRGDKEKALARIEEARLNGWTVHLIVVSLSLHARTVKEAEAVIAEERGRGNDRPIRVYDVNRDARGELALLASDVELPSLPG